MVVSLVSPQGQFSLPGIGTAAFVFGVPSAFNMSPSSGKPMAEYSRTGKGGG